MAIALTVPASVAGSTATLTATATTGNVLVWELTARPSASALTLGVLTTTGLSASRTAQDVADDEDERATWTPDVPGGYTWTCHEFRRVISIARFGGGASGQHCTYVASQSGTVHVGDVVELPIVTELGTGATLELTIVDDTVMLARFTKELTEASRLAFENSAVRAVLAALIGSDIATLGTDLQTGTNELRAEYTDHRALTGGSVHATADTVNTVTLTASASQTGAIALLNELRTRIVAHLTSDSHSPAGSPIDDTKNVPVVGAAKSVAQATVLLADLRERVYERHRVQISAPAVHGGTGDTTNALAAPSPLDSLIVAYLDALVGLTATVGTNDPQGIGDMVQRYGFALFSAS